MRKWYVLKFWRCTNEDLTILNSRCLYSEQIGCSSGLRHRQVYSILRSDKYINAVATNVFEKQVESITL